MIVRVEPPFRLDLTAAVLRRLSTNVVDREANGVYTRLTGDPAAPALLRVTQPAPDAVQVELRGIAGVDAAALATRILGLDRDTAPFVQRSRAHPWLHHLARGAEGVRPPRYPSLWEAAVNAIVFQQVSIHAAAAILRRTIEHLVRPVEIDGAPLFPFPGPQAYLAASPEALRACGLSINKVVALEHVARAIAGGELDETALERLPTPELTATLVAHRGIGPWTAAVIALRGFGRLDVFPMNDSGAARTLRELSGEERVDVEAILRALGDTRGLLYYHLLLGRLAARGEVTLGGVSPVPSR